MQLKSPAKTDLSKNIKLYYAAVGIIILGYIVLSIGTANSFTSLTLGPLVLVLGYLVAIPVALLTDVNKDASDKKESKKK